MLTKLKEKYVDTVDGGCILKVSLNIIYIYIYMPYEIINLNSKVYFC